MTTPRYIVLRDYGDRLQTIGPMAQAFHGEAQADQEARAQSDRNPSQFFVVARVVVEYGHEAVATVRKVFQPTETVTPIHRGKM